MKLRLWYSLTSNRPDLGCGCGPVGCLMWVVIVAGLTTAIRGCLWLAWGNP